MIVKGKYKQAAYEQAKSFRMRGFSYAEIAKICTVSTSTVHAWLAHESFSQSVTVVNKKRAATENKARIGLVNKARRTERAAQYKAVLTLAETEYKHYRTSPLFMAGLMLYFSHGDDNAARTIRFSGSRPELHRIFVSFATEFLGVPRKTIRLWLLLYPTHKETMCMQHWSKKTGIGIGQFHKNQVVKSRSNKPALHFGVGNTIIGSTLLKQKLIKWVKLAQKELSK